MKITERGWAGHFICADKCQFRRNTLIEHGETKIVISTVGRMLVNRTFETIGHDRHYETMVFHAKKEGRFWDADTLRRVDVNGECCISELDAEDRANDMHDRITMEIVDRVRRGELK